MRIESIALAKVRLRLVHEFQTSSHRKDHLDHILVRLTDADGTVGWGEIASPSDPYYCAETVDTAWLVATRYLAPSVLDTEAATPGELEDSWRRIRGHEFAKAGFSIAAWSLWTAQQGVPLARALGGTREEVVAGVSLGIERTIDDLLVQVQAQVDAGYQRIKLKIAPGWDLDPVAAVRSAFPDHDVHVDANGAYGSDDETFSHLRRLDDFHLTMIEQPFAPRDFTSHARLQAVMGTPVCLDESVVTVDDLHTMLALKAGRIVNIKVSRVGGLSAARRLHDIAQEDGIPVWCGGMHEFGIGRAANVALSSLPGFVLPSDVSASSKYFRRDIIDPPITADHGVVRVPTSPGLGVHVDCGWMDAHTLESIELDVNHPNGRDTTPTERSEPWQ